MVFNAQSLTQRSGAGNRRRTVALDSLIDGPSHNGDISALTEQIDDSVQQNGRILATGNGHEDGRVFAFDQRQLQAEFLADLLPHRFCEVFPAEGSAGIGLFHHRRLATGVATRDGKQDASDGSAMTTPAWDVV